MKRCLVVANRTLGGEHLLEALRARLAQGPCHFHVLVPATADPSGWTHDEQSAHALASERLEVALKRLGELGAEVTGEVGDERPADAIMDVLRQQEFDEIVLSTLPPRVSHWLKMDLLSRLERTVDIPVAHVIAQDAEAGSR